MRLRLLSRRSVYTWIGDKPNDTFIFSKTALLCMGLAAAAVIFIITSSISISNPFFSLVSSLTTSSQQNHGPKAHVLNGTYIGKHDHETKQDYFLGIPYAQPPIGDLRFRVPNSLNTSWSTPKTVLTYAPSCWQIGSSLSHDHGKQAFSEDCLYLNIFRPTNFHASLPVAVWFHGGGFKVKKPFSFNLSSFVGNSIETNQPVLAINFNYRLTGWGLLNSDEEPENSNVALRDQRLALHWIQENIAAFGGDPNKVTIWGVSAGAASVGFQLLAYGRDDKLFRGAIMQSGSPIPYQTMNHTSRSRAAVHQVVHAVGCDNSADALECLRNVSDYQLNDAFDQQRSWFPLVDGDFIQNMPSKQLMQQRFAKIPILIGFNSDEGTLFGDTSIEDDRSFMNYLKHGPPGNGISEALAQKIFNAYPDDPCDGVPEVLECARPPRPFGAQYRRSARYAGDVSIIANRRLTCEAWNNHSIPAYSYRFNAHPLGPPSRNLKGVTHFMEVAFVFDNHEAVEEYLYSVSGRTADDGSGHTKPYYDLAKLMSNSWISFVHSQDPNSFRQDDTSLETWPSYDNSHPRNYVFDLGNSHTETDTFRLDAIALLNNANDEYGR